MKKVKVLQSFFVTSKSTQYLKDWKGEVSNELADRHGPDGTGFLDVIGDVEVKPKANLKIDKK
jgi:hypothetical protein